MQCCGYFFGSLMCLPFSSVAFSLGKIENPSSCENFEISDLLECSEMIGVDKGCCNKSCSAVFTKVISPTCTLIACTLHQIQVVPLEIVMCSSVHVICTSVCLSLW